MLKIEELIKENNVLVEELDGMDYENDKSFYAKHIRYIELQNMITLNTRAERQKEISEIRYFITKNKDEILDIFNNKCEVCSFDFKDVLVVHHIIPISDGGSNELGNLSVLCPTCHTIIHKLMSDNKQGRGQREFRKFEEWTSKNIPTAQVSQLITLSYRRREFD